MRGNLIVGCTLLAIGTVPVCKAADHQKQESSQPAKTGTMYNGNNLQTPEFGENSNPGGKSSNGANATGADTATSGGSGARHGGGG